MFSRSAFGLSNEFKMLLFKFEILGSETHNNLYFSFRFSRQVFGQSDPQRLLQAFANRRNVATHRSKKRRLQSNASLPRRKSRTG